MKSVRKILALALAMTMMFAMSITAFATVDEPAYRGATIIVTGADNATLTYAQVVKLDPSKETGWSIVSGYSTLFKKYGDGVNEQSMLKGWIAAEAQSEATRIANLTDVATSDALPKPLTGAQPGLYLIKGEEEGFAYSPMLAYVSIDDAKSGNTITVVAKKTPKKIEKEYADGDGNVEIGDEIEYTVNATIPYLPKGGEAKLIITDTITGGKFVTVKEGENAGKVEVKVTIANVTTPRYIDLDAENKITVDLQDLITEDNTNANKAVAIAYTAIVVDEIIDNTAEMNHNPDTDVTVTSYTGKLKITKYNEANANEKKTLAGAKFVVVNAAGKYAVMENGKLKEWVDTYETANGFVDECLVTTVSDGTATVAGFDKDETYKFHEVVAPEGYSLNPNDATAIWKEGIADPAAQIAEAEMNDSTLSNLPYTGGKGTAAFTGFGVLLMSIAAGLYYTNKKNKSAK